MNMKSLNETKAILKELTASELERMEKATMRRDLERRLDDIEEAARVQPREKKRAEAWWADYLQRAAAELGDSAALMEKANNGDTEAQAGIMAALDRAPGFVAHAGSFMTRTEEALLNVTCGGDWTLLEARKRTLRTMRDEIAGPNPTGLEAALAHCAAMSLVEADELATRALRNSATDAQDRRRTRAHNRAMSAARTLATVRRLALPVVQVNVAQRQVNVASVGAVPTGNHDDGDD